MLTCDNFQFQSWLFVFCRQWFVFESPCSDSDRYCLAWLFIACHGLKQMSAVNQWRGIWPGARSLLGLYTRRVWISAEEFKRDIIYRLDREESRKGEDLLHMRTIFAVLLARRCLSVSAHVTYLSPSLSVCVCVCLSGKCTVAKRLIGSGCRLWWWRGRTTDGCIRRGWWSSKRRGSFGG